MKKAALSKALRNKSDSKWSITTEKANGSTRYGVYHQEKGDMKVMGLGSKGKDRARAFLRYK